MLGSGSSVGSPVVGRDYENVQEKNWRTRSSVYISIDNKDILIDTGPDFRYQAIKNGIKNIDFVLYTHSHADHTHGIDDLRIYSYIRKDRINCFGNEYTLKEIKQNFSYIFDLKNISGKPRLNMKIINGEFVEQKIHVIPLPIIHKDWNVLGYRIDNFAYITDCSAIPEETINKMQNLDLLILDALRFSQHDAHLSVEEAVELSKKIKAKRTVLTHMGSDLDYYDLFDTLPKGIEPGYDGLLIEL